MSGIVVALRTGVLLVAAYGLVAILSQLFPPLWQFPVEWQLPIQSWVGGFLDWLVKEASIGPFSVREITRFFAWVLSWPFDFVNGLFWKGFQVGDKARILPVSWVSALILAGYLGWRIGGMRLSLLGGGVIAFFVFFGYWESAMKTLSSIAMVVPISYFSGMFLGVLGYKFPRLKPLIILVLDFAQTVPIFAYLLPILFLFGFGPLSAMIATLIYAMPPMVRATLLGLERVPESVKEAGLMSGATQRQLIWGVMIPSARPALLVGLNQVIMLSLNAVIIASLIGAGGLGHDVMRALKALRVGQGLEAGMAIVLLAILFDRFSRAYIVQNQLSSEKAPYSGSHAIAFCGLLLGIQLVSNWIPVLQAIPNELTISTAPFWDQLVDNIVINHYEPIEGFKNTLLLYLLLPIKKALVGLPWIAVAGTLTLLAFRLGGISLSILVGGFVIFVMISGFWEKAMISVYLVGVAVLIALLIGFPIGVWASTNVRVSNIISIVTDTLQTLPSFVYLIPVVMLFQAGDVAALIAVVAYAIAPIIRYTDSGFRNVPAHLIEAATAIGCNRWQVLTKVKCVSALPEVMLGINQTVMLALSMLVITALVGTRDLGQEVYIGLARTDTGRGFVAGACVACIAILADRLIHAYVKQEKRKLGVR